MPYTKKQVRVAEAVKHGWKPKGSAAGFTENFAEKVLTESEKPGGIKGAATEKKRKQAAENMLGKGAHAGIKR